MRQATAGSQGSSAAPHASASASPAAPAVSYVLSKDGSEEIYPVPKGEGMRRGKWEAPAWTLWVVGAAVIVVATLYLLRRLGVLRLNKERQSK